LITSIYPMSHNKSDFYQQTSNILPTFPPQWMGYK
jgi:hypothetical protein